MEPSELTSALLAQAIQYHMPQQPRGTRSTSFASHSTTQTQTRGRITTQQQPHETAHARFASYITTTTTLQPSFTVHDPIIRVTSTTQTQTRGGITTAHGTRSPSFASHSTAPSQTRGRITTPQQPHATVLPRFASPLIVPITFCVPAGTNAICVLAGT